MLAVFLTVSALILSGCERSQVLVVEGSSVTVAQEGAFFSFNDRTSFGDAPENRGVVAATNSNFFYVTDELALVRDESFGVYEVLVDEPFTVKYTMSDTAQWSDGTPIDSADLLLAWVANSGALNDADVDPREFTDPVTGAFTDDYPNRVVYFDGAVRSGLSLVSQTPVIDDRSITLVYDEFFVDWEQSFAVGVPAHITAGKALDIDDASEAKRALVDAVQGNDRAALATISRFWNTGFVLSDLPANTDLLVGSGPYVVTEFVANEFVTLSANERYRGDHLPEIEEITVRFISDPLAAIDALAAGEVDVISPDVTPEFEAALETLDGVTIVWGDGPVFDHIDLVFENSKNGTFDDPLLREAFLKTVPRQQIVDQLMAPTLRPLELRDSTVFLPGSPGYDEAIENNGMAVFTEVDVAGARAIVERSGATNPVVCILHDSSDAKRVAAFELMAVSAAEAGFVVEDCGSPEWAGLLGLPRAYDAALFGWEVRSFGVANTVATFRSGAINNLNGYSNLAVDALLDDLDDVLEPDRKLDILLRIDELLVEDSYGLVFAHHPGVAAHSDRLAGVSPGPLSSTVLWNVWGWRLTESHEPG